MGWNCFGNALAKLAHFAQTCQGVVTIGGKVLRRSFDTASAKSSLHMVST